VVFLHYRKDLETFLPVTKVFDSLLASGDLGVDLFFMLSGFVLMLNYRAIFPRFDRRKYLNFLWIRLARIYPAHLFTLLAVTALVLCAEHLHLPVHQPERYTAAAWVQNVFLIQSWTGVAHAMSWNFPAWSISSEWFAYLWFPFLVPTFVRIRRPAIGCCVALLPYLIVCLMYGDQPIIPLALLRVSCEFVAGCMLYLAFERGFRIPGNTALWACLIVSFLSVAHAYGITRELVLPAFAIVLLRLAANSGGFLSGKVGVFWGEASYALYLTHGICQELLERMIKPSHFVNASLVVRCMAAASYAVAIASAAILTYLFVERPARAWMRSLSRDRPGSSVIANSASSDIAAVQT
jgi:peptidoglycan/LPS O-acetylase OafA/YrhL